MEKRITLNPTLMKVIQEGLVAVSVVAIKAVLADPEAKRVTDEPFTFGCQCEHCS